MNAVAAVRRFNRFYTSQIGVLHEGLLSSPFTLTEVRVLYELAHRDAPLAKDLAADLGIDPGYLSRILLGFKRKHLVAQTRARDDARRRHLALTARGARTFAGLDARAGEEVRELLTRVRAEHQPRLLKAMQTIESALQPRSPSAEPYVLRPHRPGDIGWVVQRHGELYAHEHGWNEEFEGLVARITAEFIEHFNPKRERCWIAERGGERVGCVLLVEKSPKVAQLRLLLVEPGARGLGIGRRLVSECEQFARRAGYVKIRLWTQNTLAAARHLYEEGGYGRVSEVPHRSFGADLVAEVWELRLS